MTLNELQKAIKLHKRIFVVIFLIIVALSFVLSIKENRFFILTLWCVFIEIFLGGIIPYIIAYSIIKRSVNRKVEFPPGLNENGIKKYKQLIKIYSSYVAGYVMLDIGLITYISNNFKS